MAYTENWSSDERDFGERVEALFTEVLTTKFHFQTVDRKIVDSGEKLPYYAVANATNDEDTKEATDKWLWSPEHERWLRIDITVSTDRDRINYKERRATKYGGKVIRFSAKTLNNALLGSRRHLIIVAGLVDKAFTSSETVIG